MCRRALPILMACVFFAPTAAAQLKTRKRVLILNQLEPLASPGVAELDDGIVAGLEKSAYQIDFYSENLDANLSIDEASQRALREWYVQKYHGREPDAIVTVGLQPLELLAHADEQFFPDAPVIFCGAAEEMLGHQKLGSRFTGVWGIIEPAKTIDVALKLQPGTRHVVVVGGVGEYDRYVEAIVRQNLRNYESRLDITYLTDLDMPTLRDRLRHLPPQTVIYHTSIMQDAAGTNFIDATQSVPLVVEAANAPVFTADDVDIGRGTVGGDVLSFSEQGKIAAQITARVLQGERPANIPVVRSADVYMFDARALRRWGFKESDLPPGSILLHPSPWDSYRWYIVGGVSLFVLETGLVFGLLWQRARRTRAQSALRESEERFRLVANRAPVLIWMAGPDKLCTYFNRFWLEFTGRAIESELGNGWLQGVHPADVSVCGEIYTQAFDRRAEFRMQYRLRRHDGEYRWMVDIGVPRFNSDGSFAGYIGSAIDVTDHKEAEVALSGISRRLIEAQEEERRHIARELHDDLAQRIALLSIGLQKLEDSLPGSDLGLRSQTTDLSSRTRELSNDVHALSHRLHSSKLELLGLVAAVKSLCKEMAAQHGVEINFTHSDVGRLSYDISLCLFRVLQEALGNGVKHSGVKQFDVNLRGTPDAILLTYRDRGVGFEVDKISSNSGLGLVSMRERAGLFRGTISIISTPSIGTEIQVRIPLADQPSAGA